MTDPNIRQTYVTRDFYNEHTTLEMAVEHFNDVNDEPTETLSTLVVTIDMPPEVGEQHGTIVRAYIERGPAIAQARFVLNQFGIAHSAPPSTQVLNDVIEAARSAVVSGFSEETCDELTRAMTVFNEELTKGIR